MARARTTYTPEQRDHALDLYREHGAAEAGRRTGIPDNTIRQWASRARVSRYRAENTRAAADAQRVTWEARRLDLANDLGELAANAVRLIGRGQGEAIGKVEATTSTADLKNHAIILGILVEKANLLVGAPTDRREHVVDPLVRVEQIRAGIAQRDELAERRGDPQPTMPDPGRVTRWSAGA